MATLGGGGQGRPICQRLGTVASSPAQRGEGVILRPASWRVAEDRAGGVHRELHLHPPTPGTLQTEFCGKSGFGCGLEVPHRHIARSARRKLSVEGWAQFGSGNARILAGGGDGMKPPTQRFGDSPLTLGRRRSRPRRGHRLLNDPGRALPPGPKFTHPFISRKHTHA